MSNSKINNLDITNAKRPKTKDIAVRDEYGQIREFPITGELPLTIFVNIEIARKTFGLGKVYERIFRTNLSNNGLL